MSAQSVIQLLSKAVLDQAFRARLLKASLKSGSVIGTLVIALAVAQSAGATSASLDLVGPATPTCTPDVGTIMAVSLSIDAGTHYFVTIVENPTHLTSTIAFWSFGGPISFNGVIGNIPPQTQPGDTLIFSVSIYNDAAHNQLLASDSISFNCSTGAVIGSPSEPGSGCGADGRINQNCAAPVVAYCDGDTLKVYGLDAANEGSLLFTFDLADVPADGSTDVLLTQVGEVKLVWRHEDGLLKLLAPQADGKTYYMLFDPVTCMSEREGAEWGL